MMEQIDIAKKSKIVLLKHEIELWENTAYQAQIRHRAHKILGSSEDELKTCEQALTKALKMIDIYTSFVIEIEEMSVAENIAEHVNGKEPEHANLTE